MTNDTENRQSRIKKTFASRLLIRPAVDEDPRLLGKTTKAVILMSLALCAASAPFSSTIYFPGIPIIMTDLNATSMNTILTAALFVLFMGIAPIFWAAFSDYYKFRRWLLLLSMLIFALSSLGCALVNNIGGLIVLRCIQSVGASCGQSVGAGVIADCYPVEKRGAAFGKFFFGLFVGPLFGPIIGGFLVMSNETWRATFWFCVAYAGFTFAFVFFTFPETFRENAKFDQQLPTTVDPAESHRQHSSDTKDNASKDDLTIDQPQTEKTANGTTTNTSSAGRPSFDRESAEKTVAPPRSAEVSLNPIKPLLMLRHPFIFLSAIIGGIVFGSMFAVQPVLTIAFERQYHFPAWKTGLSFLGGGIANMIGAVITNLISDRLLLRARAKRGGKEMAEDRLSIALWPSVFIIMPFGLLLFGWSVAHNMSVWAPIFGFAILSLGMNQIMTGLSAYLVDAAPGQGASITAAVNLVRMVFACILTIVSEPMITNIGAGYMGVLFGCLVVASGVLLVILKVYGERMRRYSGF